MNEKAQMKNIIFIGMPAVGKSTVGVVIAKRMGYEFIDTDLLIQKQKNVCCAKLLPRKALMVFWKLKIR